MSGIVWFDRNQNGRLDPGEWPLPGVPVALTTIVLAHAASPAVRPAALAGRQPAVGSAVAVGSATTAADGSYRFPGLPPGAYTVSASVSIGGFNYTSDSDGGADWTVHVDVAGNGGGGTADFAGVGRGSLGGTIFNSTTRAPIGGADVTCRWAGLDDTLHTADDVLMTVVADGGGGFGLGQLPYGIYSCSGRDPVTGATSAAAGASVLSPTQARVQLPIAQARPAAGLPRTGPAETRLLALGLALMLTGAGALVVGTRARRPRGPVRAARR